MPSAVKSFTRYQNIYHTHLGMTHYQCFFISHMLENDSPKLIASTVVKQKQKMIEM